MSQAAFRSRSGKRRWPVPCDTCKAPIGRACIPQTSAASTTPDHAARRRAIAALKETP